MHESPRGAPLWAGPRRCAQDSTPRLTGPGSQDTPPLGPRTDHPSGLARADALRAHVVTLRLPRPGLSGSGPTRLTPARPRAHLHSMYSHLLHFGLDKSPSLVCAARPAARLCANDHWWRVSLILSRHGAAQWALGSDFRARCKVGLGNKQRPMDDLSLCALGPILI